MMAKLKSKEMEHSPTLNTVIMVENTLEESVIKIPELKRQLPRQVNHNTLITILQYLDESNKIAIGIKGITWIHNTNQNFRNAINRGLEL